MPRPRRLPEWHAPDRFVGEELQRRIEDIRGGSRTELVPCSVCGQQMFPSSLGGHARCLGVESEQEPPEGPRLIGDFLASAVADLGRQAAADDAEKARAAEAVKAAMPAAPPVPEQELPAAVFEPDLDARRRITRALSGAMRCRLCRKPIHSVADWSGRDLGGDPMPTHFICAEAEAQGVDVDDVYALKPHGGKVKARGRDLANVIWATVDETVRHWTDWAAAVATPEEGAAADDAPRD